MSTTDRVAENKRDVISHTSGSWKSGVKVSVGRVGSSSGLLGRIRSWPSASGQC